MKIKLILIFLLLFSFLSSINSQNLLVVNKDSLIVLTKGQIDTINLICLDRNCLKKELIIKDQILKNDSILLYNLNLKSNNLNNIINKQKEQLYLQREFLEQKQKEWSDNYKKSKRKGLFYGSVGGTFIGIIIGILIVK